MQLGRLQPTCPLLTATEVVGFAALGRAQHRAQPLLLFLLDCRLEFSLFLLDCRLRATEKKHDMQDAYIGRAMKV